MNTQNYDSIIFDMDGTLWDAVDSYCAIWNNTIDDCCPGKVEHVGYAKLSALMGSHLEYIYEQIVGDAYPMEPFMKRLTEVEKQIMRSLGGKLYPLVRESIARLAETHKLFMVSNCTADGLPDFFAVTGLGPYFVEGVSHGENGKEKDSNIRMLVEKYGLERPLYVGDTQGDCASAHRAGVDFAWASYGFGRDVEGAEHTLGSIADLLLIS